MTLIRDHEDKDHAEQDGEEIDLSAPETRAAGRWNSAGVPGERSKDFKNALRRLIRMLGPMRFVLGIVLMLQNRLRPAEGADGGDVERQEPGAAVILHGKFAQRQLRHAASSTWLRVLRRAHSASVST